MCIGFPGRDCGKRLGNNSIAHYVDIYSMIAAAFFALVTVLIAAIFVKKRFLKREGEKNDAAGPLMKPWRQIHFTESNNLLIYKTGLGSRSSRAQYSCVTQYKQSTYRIYYTNIQRSLMFHQLQLNRK